MKVISGGQTGVDQAALDVALEVRFDVGGWCTNGRRTEDGPLAKKYAFLQETPSGEYPQRTEWNVRDSDATLVLHRGQFGAGTRKTLALVSRTKKPYIAFNMMHADAEDVRKWLKEIDVQTLNVAGPRESGDPGIYNIAKEFLGRVWRRE